jgi:methyltransferase (TIGR00027 family)
MQKSYIQGPEHTAVRVALWRALHVEVDAPPHVLKDQVGSQIVGEENWRARPDMGLDFSKPMRASIVGRARFIEDLVLQKVQEGVTQYVILGAGLDTFAQRHPELGSQLEIFEVDQPGPQAWKQKRLFDLNLAQPKHLHFVPVDFEAGQSWLKQLIANGFKKDKSAVFVSTGVSMYLTQEANQATFSQIAKLASGSTFAMTFMLALDYLLAQERSIMEFVMKKAAESGTPFLSLYPPDEILKMAQTAGFKSAQYISADDIYVKYFSNRTDGLRAGQAEAFVVAST